MLHREGPISRSMFGRTLDKSFCIMIQLINAACLSEEKQCCVSIRADERLKYFCLYRMRKKVMPVIFILARIEILSSSHYNVNFSIEHEEKVYFLSFFLAVTWRLFWCDIAVFLLCVSVLRCTLRVLTEVIFLIMLLSSPTDVTSDRPRSLERDTRFDTSTFISALIRTRTDSLMNVVRWRLSHSRSRTIVQSSGLKKTFFSRSAKQEFNQVISYRFGSLRQLSMCNRFNLRSFRA